MGFVSSLIMPGRHPQPCFSGPASSLLGFELSSFIISPDTPSKMGWSGAAHDMAFVSRRGLCFLAWLGSFSSSLVLIQVSDIAWKQTHPQSLLLYFSLVLITPNKHSAPHCFQGLLAGCACLETIAVLVRNINLKINPSAPKNYKPNLLMSLSSVSNRSQGSDFAEGSRWQGRKD